ncbi:MAG: flippase [Chloroflexia bacterium]|nr:flippase [Chloroflexia bacterium]
MSKQGYHLVAEWGRLIAAPAGSWQPPGSAQDDFALKLGLFLGGLLLLLLLLALAAHCWSRLYQAYESGETGVVRRVLKNSLTPTIANLINKGVDTAFAIVVLHYLGQEGNGYYGLAALIVARYLMTLTDFGLGTLTTREVARDPAAANRYLVNTTLIRWLLSVISLPAVAAIIQLYRLTPNPLQPPAQAALWILTLSLFPASLSSSISALFYARERMEIPAFAGLLVNVLKVFAGVGVLLLGGGVVGLAGSALAVTTVNALLFVYLQRRLLFRPQLQFDPSLCRWMLRESLPLLLNHLLLWVIIRSDTFILQAHHGANTVGAYDAAYKLPSALSEVPYYIIMGLFPLLARFALKDRERLSHTVQLAGKMLLLLSLPLAAIASTMSQELILVLGGLDFLPDSAIALSILIWYLPLSYVNGVIQYALIAMDRQGAITRAFVLAVAFNLATNLIWIPAHSYRAASIITILTEVLLFAFLWLTMRREMGHLPLLAWTWRPLLATALMAAAMLLLRSYLHWTAALLLGPALYVGLLLLLRTFSPEEKLLLRRLLPAKG